MTLIPPGVFDRGAVGLIYTGNFVKATAQTWAGMVERWNGLTSAGIDLQHLPGGTAGSIAAVDDMLDAAVLAWSAQRLKAATARCFPDPPEAGTAGRLVAIWA